MAATAHISTTARSPSGEGVAPEDAVVHTELDTLVRLGVAAETVLENDDFDDIVNRRIRSILLVSAARLLPHHTSS